MLPSAPRSTAVLLAPSLPTCHQGGDPLAGGRCLRLELFLVFYLAERFPGSFQKVSASFCVLWCGFMRCLSICGSVPEGNAVSLSPQRKCAGVNGVNASSVS